MPELKYVGGLVIRAKNPHELARWYSEKFGLLMGVEHKGTIYGGFRNDHVSFHFGIAPLQRRGRRETGSGVNITFYVDDFAGYVSQLAECGLQPIGEAHDEDGHFAVYRDPEGNDVTIWAD